MPAISHEEMRRRTNAWRKQYRASHPEVRARERAINKASKLRHRESVLAKQRESNRRYYIENRERLLAANKAWADANREHYLARKRQYHHEHRPAMLEALKNRYHANRTAYLEKFKQYRQRLKSEHPEKLKEYTKRQTLSERADPVRHLRRCLRARIRSGFKRYLKGLKTKHSHELLGCSYQFLKQYLEAMFKPGMTWDNLGVFGWHVDHIKPISAFDLTIESEQLKAFNYSNLQPLWWHENLKKGASYLR